MADIKQMLIANAWMLSRIPFLNSIHLQGAVMEYGNKFMVQNKISCTGSGNKIILKGKGVVQRCHFHIQGNNNTIIVGDNTNLTEAELWLQYDGNTIVIGDDTDICGKTHLACIEGTTISIGNECLFSSEIVFRTGDSHSIVNMEGKRINRSKDITIGDHVWVAHRVLVNKGVSVARDTMIGTGAVVTRSCEQSNVILAGNPAKVIKENVNWDRNRLPVD